FEPVVLVAGVPTTILVSPKLPVKDLKDLIAYGKQHRLSVGNPGYGTGGHIVAALFADTAGLEVTHVPYRGVGPMLTDVTSGQIDVGFAGFVPQILNMKALAVTAEKRAEVLPNVPTVHEALGLDVVSGVWYGIFAPAGTPRDIVEKVNAGVNAFFKTPRGRELSKSMGMQPLGGTPEDMRTLMKSDVQRLKPVIEKAHIKMD
ncbi:MAG: tripartite tricarboxylate transporter substrate binding protein, partial [Rhizobiales bacterium]|nr:tripartite tricarboxylate transporter substrate binding protein [Hyphomicrobiales bacterium]